MGKIERWLGLIDNLNDRVGRIISFLMLFIMAIVVWEVTLRYFFNSPTYWAHESSTFIFGGYFFLGGAYALRHRAHVRMDLIYDRFSPRGRAIVGLVSFFPFFIFCGVLLWHGWQMAWTSLLIRETTNTYWGPPIYPLRLTIPLGAFLILLQGLAKFIRDLIITVTGREAA